MTIFDRQFSAVPVIHPHRDAGFHLCIEAEKKTGGPFKDCLMPKANTYFLTE